MNNKKALPFFLICITLIGAGLRLFHINFQSLWIEELYTIRVTDPINNILTIVDISRGDGSQAFSMLLHYVFNVFHYEDSVGRILCALIGIAAIPVTYFLVNDLEGHKTGLFASLLIAINYWHIYYSQELSSYSMAFLFSTLSYLFFIRAYKFTRGVDFMGYVICTIVLLNTLSFGFLILTSQIITLVLLDIVYHLSKKHREGFIIGVVTILLFASWTQTISINLFTGYAWMPHPKFYFIPAYFHNYFGKDILVSIAFSFLSVLFFRSVIKNYSQKQSDPLHLILILWLALSYLIPYAISLFGNSILDIRYTMVSLPAWIAIIAIGWSKIENPKWKTVLIVIVSLASFINLFFIKEHYSKIQKQQLREVSQLIKTKNKSRYPMYSSFSWEYNFYFRDDQEKVIKFDSLQNNQKSLTKFWLLQVGSPEGEVLKLKDQFTVVEQYSFFNANALLMEKRKRE